VRIDDAGADELAATVDDPRPRRQARRLARRHRGDRAALEDDHAVVDPLASGREHRGAADHHGSRGGIAGRGGALDRGLTGAGREIVGDVDPVLGEIERRLVAGGGRGRDGFLGAAARGQREQHIDEGSRSELHPPGCNIGHVTASIRRRRPRGSRGTWLAIPPRR
jgi:hypothetical protein